MTRGNNIS